MHVMPPNKRQKTNKTRKVIFGRALDQQSSSPLNVVMTRQHPRFIPNSPPHSIICSLRRSADTSTCSLFGPHHEIIYNGFIFYASFKSYDDCVSSGYGTRVKRNSTSFKCTVNHTNFSFPTDWLIDDYLTTSCGDKSIDSSCNSNVSCSYSHSSLVDESSIADDDSEDAWGTQVH